MVNETQNEFAARVGSQAFSDNIFFNPSLKKVPGGQMLKKITVQFFVFLMTAGVCVAAQAESYRVGPGDVLEISVWRDETLSRELIVPPDGVLSFPLIGDVKVAGMAVPEIRETIRQKLTEYVPDASVTVILKTINSLRAYVIGQVKNPGTFPITLETRVMHLLSMAQGLTPFASERDIHVLRHSGDKVEKIPFNYREVVRGNQLEQNILLRSGDVVVVP
jgi:polysaccharide biosynthesis/export protein